MGFHVNPDALEEYADAADSFHQAISQLTEYMHSTACDKSGFTGLFMILQPVVDLVASLYGDTLKYGDQKLTSLVDGIRQASAGYSKIDENVENILKGLLAELDSTNTPATA